MQNLNFRAPFEVKFVTETGMFEGYASVFNVIDKVNDKIVRGAFKESLDNFIETKTMPPLLWQHNSSEPIGMWTEMYEDEHGLFVKGKLFIDEIKTASEAYKLLQEKVVTGLSIGYRALDFYKDDKTGARILTKVDLQEVSLVTFPANDYARVKGSENSKVPSEREVEAILRNSGLSRRQAKGLVACGYKGLSQSGDDEIRNLTKIILNAAKELETVS